MELEKLMKMCRTCLTANENMKSVFGVEELMEQPTCVADILMSCANVQVIKDDGMPQEVCFQCAQEISRAFVFRKMCEKSDSTLRQWIAETLLPITIESITNSGCTNVVEDKYQPETKVDGFETGNRIDNKYAEAVDNFLLPNKGDSDDGDGEEFLEGTDEPNLEDNSADTYSCDICLKVFLDSEEYHLHASTPHERPYQCEHCEKRFVSESMLMEHKSTDHPENEQPAVKKKGKVVRKHNLPRTCEICSKTFRFHSNLERHMLIHTGEKPYLCNVCGKGFAQLSYLKIHSFIHTGEKPYKCQMCNKGFAAPGTLMTHVRTHTGERPHICKICGKDFSQSGYLSAHVRMHTGEKPVQCKVCNRRFSQSGRLIIHMRIHSGEKPYTCETCGQRFAVKGTLKKHIRTHTGERPYICCVCGQSFAQSGTLVTHMKVHNKNK